MFKLLFPGTFDPPTLGHIMLIKRGAALCDHLVVGIGKNLSKTKAILTVEERIEALKHETSSLKNVEIVSFSGLAVNFAKQIGVNALLRGFRTSSDVDFELQMARANKKLSGIETLFLMAEDEAHISSTLIRELAANGASLKDFVPEYIESTLQHRIQKEN
ncbi:MAG: pantetheine-phosphate adenylyltransferase [Verrucomicrobia bacterium]|nr:pantetheine-phosphate adenylyltransferase [Verrucomicrobiota bacterium]